MSEQLRPVGIRRSWRRHLTDALVCVAAGLTVSQGFGCLCHGSAGVISCRLFPPVGILSLLFTGCFMMATRNNMQSCCEEWGENKAQM